MTNKTTFYLIGLVILIALGIYFVSSTNPGSTNIINNAIGASQASAINSPVVSGAVQEITLSFKNGNYYPNTINVQPNKPVRIYLDSSVQGCYRSFTVKSFGVSKRLATPSDYVEFTPDKEGTFGFACSMGMGTGKLIVGNANTNSATLATDTKVSGSCGGGSSSTGTSTSGSTGGSCGSSGGGCGCGGAR